MNLLLLEQCCNLGSRSKTSTNAGFTKDVVKAQSCNSLFTVLSLAHTNPEGNKCYHYKRKHNHDIVSQIKIIIIIIMLIMVVGRGGGRVMRVLVRMWSNWVNSYTATGNVKWCSHFGKYFGSSSESNIVTVRHSNSTSRSIPKRNLKKELNCPSVDEWNYKVWHIYMMECFITIKK